MNFVGLICALAALAFNLYAILSWRRRGWQGNLGRLLIGGLAFAYFITLALRTA